LKKFLPYCLIVTLFSCEVEKKEFEPFFNLGDIIIEQHSALRAANPSVVKTITYNGTETTDTVHNLNWEKELILLKDYDTFKPKWRQVLEEQVEELPTTIEVFYSSGDRLKMEKIDTLSAVLDHKQRIQTLYISASKENYFYTTTNVLRYSFKPYNEYFMILDEYTIHQTITTKLNTVSEFKLNAKVLL
jgi:hypothetical protein